MQSEKSGKRTDKDGYPIIHLESLSGLSADMTIRFLYDADQPERIEFDNEQNLYIVYISIDIDGQVDRLRKFINTIARIERKRRKLRRGGKKNV